MTRERRTIQISPPRRQVYPETPSRFEPPVQQKTTFEDSTDWSDWRTKKAISDHANQRSNRVGDGRDSVASFCGGQRLTVTTPAGYVGDQLRVAHGLGRVPTAIVWFSTQNPNSTLTGIPEGSTGAFSNQAWTAKEVFVTSNAAPGETFEFVVA